MLTQAVLLGVGAGVLDAMLALAIVLIFRTTGVLNFAQASTGAVGAYVMFALGTRVPLWIAVAAGVVASAVLGMVTYGAVAGIRSRHQALTSAVATLAVAILFRQAIAAVWGTTVGTIPDPFAGRILTVGSSSLPAASLAAIIISAGVALAIGMYLRWTRTGTMLRAIADRPQAAELCGAPVTWMVAVVWASAGALSAAAGFFAGLLGLTPSFLDPFFLAALLAALLGGLRSLPAAWLGAVVLEVARSLFGVYAPASVSVYTQAFLIVLIISVMVVAPRRWLAGVRQRTV